MSQTLTRVGLVPVLPQIGLCVVTLQTSVTSAYWVSCICTLMYTWPQASRVFMYVSISAFAVQSRSVISEAFTSSGGNTQYSRLLVPSVRVLMVQPL